MLQDLLEEEPDSKCVSLRDSLIIGCLHSISIYKLALGRLLDQDVCEEVDTMITKLERGDPMRVGKYKEWRLDLSIN